MIARTRGIAGRPALPLACVLVIWRVCSADSPAEPQPQVPQAAHPAPPVAKQTPTPEAPLPEDDLFEFLGSVDMEDPGLVSYLGRGEQRPVKPVTVGVDPKSDVGDSP